MADITITIPDGRRDQLIAANSTAQTLAQLRALLWPDEFEKEGLTISMRRGNQWVILSGGRVGFIPEDFPATTLEVLIEPSPIKEERCKHERSI